MRHGFTYCYKRSRYPNSALCGRRSSLIDLESQSASANSEVVVNVDSLSNTSAASQPSEKKEEDLSDVEVGATDQDEDEEEEDEEKDAPDTETVKQRLLSSEGGYGSAGKKDKKEEEDEKKKKGRGLDFRRMVTLAKPEKWWVVSLSSCSVPYRVLTLFISLLTLLPHRLALSLSRPFSVIHPTQVLILWHDHSLPG